MKLFIAAFNSLARDIAGATLPTPMLPALARESILVGETSQRLPMNTAFIELKATDDGVAVFKDGEKVVDEVAIDGGETKFLGVASGWTITLKDSLA